MLFYDFLYNRIPRFLHLLPFSGIHFAVSLQPLHRFYSKIDHLKYREGLKIDESHKSPDEISDLYL